MIYKLITCLSIVTVSAYENDYLKRFAISSQSFSRPEISYKFSNVHDYMPRHSPENRKNVYNSHLKPEPVKYPSIQYAPLNARPSDHHADQTAIRHPDTTSPPPLYFNNVQHDNEAANKKLKDHLEPKPLREDDNVNQQNYRSFISGHNVEVYPQTTGQYLDNGVILPIPQVLNIYQKPKQNTRKFVYSQKPTTVAIPETAAKQLVVEFPKQTEDSKLLQFLPVEFDSPIRSDHKKSPTYANSLHNHLIKDKHQQTYQNPRIHLNIARTYNMANHPQESHLPINLGGHLQPNIFGKHPALSAAAFYLPNILKDQNTIMYPVRSQHK